MRVHLRYYADLAQQHTMLVLLVFAALLPVAGVGRGLGLPLLYWDWKGRWVYEAINHFSVGMMLAHATFVALALALSNPKAALSETFSDPTGKKPPRYSEVAPEYFAHGLGVVVVLNGVATALRWFIASRLPINDPSRPGLVLGWGTTLEAFVMCAVQAAGFVALGLVLVYVLPRAASKIQTEREWIRCALIWRLPERKIKRERLDELHKTLGLWVTLVFLTSLVLGVTNATPPAGFAVSLLFAIIISGYGFIRFWSRPWQGVLLPTSVVLYAAFYGCATYPSAYEIDRDWDGRENVPVPARVNDTVVVDEMLKTGEPVVVLTTTGGGIRSAFWTARILETLASGPTDLIDRTRIITGASGGMVGASHAVTSFADDECTGWREPGEGPMRSASEAASDSSLSEVTSRWFLPSGDGRGRAAEREWEEASNGRLAQPLRALSECEREGKIPSLVFSPFDVDARRPVVFSNLELDQVLRPDGAKYTSTLPEPVDFFDDTELAHPELVRVSEVARANASFPYVLPPVAVPFQKSCASPPCKAEVHEHRLVDAGYGDNYGLRLAATWVESHAQRLCKDHDGKGPPRIIVVQLRDHEPASKTAASRLPRELVTPIDGIFGGLFGNMVSWGEIGLHRVGDRFPGCVEIWKPVEFQGVASLSWELSAAEREELNTQAGAAAKELERRWAKTTGH